MWERKYDLHFLKRKNIVIFTRGHLISSVFFLRLFYKKQVRRHSVETNVRKRAILLHLLTGADVEGIF